MLNTHRQFLSSYEREYYIRCYIGPATAVTAGVTIVYSTNLAVEEDCNIVLAGVVFG